MCPGSLQRKTQTEHATMDTPPPPLPWIVVLKDSKVEILRNNAETAGECAESVSWRKWRNANKARVDEEVLVSLCCSAILLITDHQSFPRDWRRDIDPKALRAAVNSHFREIDDQLMQLGSYSLRHFWHLIFRTDIYDEVKTREDAGGSIYLETILNVIETYSSELSLSEQQQRDLFAKLVQTPLPTVDSITSKDDIARLLSASPAASVDPRSVEDYINVLAPSQSAIGADEMFRNFVKVLSSGYRQGRFYAPYVAVIQGSGSGKTALVLNSQAKGSTDIFVLYLCLRPANSSGVPPRSSGADLFQQCKTKDEFRRFYIAVFAAMKTWLSGRANAGLSASEVLQELHAHCTKESLFWDDVKNWWEQTNVPTNPGGIEVYLALQDCWRAHPALSETPPLLLFAIDEACALLVETNQPGWNLFHVWRSSTQIAMDGTASLFFVVLDTTARVGNFFPVPGRDPSARVKSRALRLCPPFHLFPFTGPWPLEDSQDEKGILRYKETVRGVTWQPLAALLRHSRPMFWSDAMVAARGDASVETLWDNMFSLAKEKLGLVGSDGGWAVGEGYLVALCYRFALSPLRRGQAEEMLASRGATLLAVGSLDAGITVKYVPEPIYGEACAAFFNQALGQEKALNYLRDIVTNGLAGRAYGKGDRGEFAAMVYLTLVMDCVQEKKQLLQQQQQGRLPQQRSDSGAVDVGDGLRHKIIFSRPALLEEFLCALTGLDFLPPEFVPFVQGWTVAFTAWTDALAALQLPACLEEALSKRVAMALAAGAEAVDLVIPLEMLNVTLSGTTSVVLVQVKNWTRHIHRAEAVDLCRKQINQGEKWSTHKQKPAVVILMMVGPGRLVGSKQLIVDESDCVFFVLDGCLCVVCNGFPSVHISTQVERLLSSLARSSDPMVSAQSANQLATIASLSENAWASEHDQASASELLQVMNEFSVMTLSRLQTWPRLEPDAEYSSLGEVPLFDSSKKGKNVKSGWAAITLKDGNLDFFVAKFNRHEGVSGGSKARVRDSVEGDVSVAPLRNPEGQSSNSDAREHEEVVKDSDESNNEETENRSKRSTVAGRGRGRGGGRGGKGGRGRGRSNETERSENTGRGRGGGIHDTKTEDTEQTKPKKRSRKDERK